MNWFKRLFRMEKDEEVWHYTCKDGHKWVSYNSPRGTYLYGESGQTRCPQCGTPICKGEIYINGKITAMGACHEGMLKKETKRKNERGL